MPHIVVIDDDPAVTSLIRRGLSYEGYIVTCASHGDEGLAAVRDQSPDLVLLDVMMPGLDGWTVLERLRKADPHLPVLFLTAKDAPADQVHGLMAGADDYITKPFVFDVLLARIQAALRRTQSRQPSLLRVADLELDPGAHRVTRAGEAITLTALEFKLLHELLLHAQQVLSKDVLLERVWDYDFGGNGNIVEVYIKQLRQKIERPHLPKLIHTVRNVGYVLREQG